ncbi:MAG: hypothetical protein HZA28_06130 [Candidatus Omnitrophica bacterium]|nr:hypothetical protein [Candidatus Omnitrophota bacterium]
MPLHSISFLMHQLYHKKSCLVSVVLLFFAVCSAGVQAKADAEAASGNASAQPEKKIKIQPAKPAERLLTREEVEKKAEEYNRAAIDLFEQGKYPQAQELWEKAIGLMENPGTRDSDVIDPQAVSTAPQASSVDPSFAGAGADSDLDQKYETGMWLLEQKEYAKAQEIFEEVQKLRPGYKNTANYLAVINELTQGEQMSGAEPEVISADESLSEGPVSVEGEEQAPVEETDSGEEETQWQEAADQAEQKRLEELEQKVEPVYAQAVEQYEHGQFTEARTGFSQVQVLYPDYALTADYLARIDDDIREAEEGRVQRERQQQEATSKKEQEEFQRAVRAKQTLYRRQQAAEAEKFYRQAIEAYKGHKFDEAENNFRKVLVLSPDYKLTEKYLERIKQDRAEEERLYQEQQRQLGVLEQARQQKFTDEAGPVANAEESRQLKLMASQQTPIVSESTSLKKEVSQPLKEQEREKKMREREQIRQDQKRARELKRTVGQKYQEVVAAYKSKQWETAAQKLGDFESFLAGEDKDGLCQKSYAARVTRLRKNIQTQQASVGTPRPESKETLAKPLPPEPPVPLGLLESKEFAPSDDLRVLRRQQQQIQKERQKIHSAIDSKIDRSYARAVDLYTKGYYQQAGELFEAINQASPVFKKTQNYLADINSKLATASPPGIRQSDNLIVTSPIYVRPRGHIDPDPPDGLKVQPQ